MESFSLISYLFLIARCIYIQIKFQINNTTESCFSPNLANFIKDLQWHYKNMLIYSFYNWIRLGRKIPLHFFFFGLHFITSFILCKKKYHSKSIQQSLKVINTKPYNWIQVQVTELHHKLYSKTFRFLTQHFYTLEIILSVKFWRGCG